MNKEKLIKIINKIVLKNGLLGKYIQNFNLSEINSIKFSSYSIIFKVKFPISDRMTAYFLTLEYNVNEVQERVYFIVDDVIVDYYINFDAEKEKLFDKLYKARDEYIDFLLKDFLGE